MSHSHYFLGVFLGLITVNVHAQNDNVGILSLSDSLVEDSVRQLASQPMEMQDAPIIAEQDDSSSRAPHHTFVKRFLKNTYRIVRDFNRVDKSYIEPQHYNFTAMLQNTNTYERYELRSKTGQAIVFSPKPSYKIGPYFGWHWFFLGYTIDLRHLHHKKAGDVKTEFDLSLYSSLVGIDIFYRKTGTDYRIQDAYLGDDIDTSPLRHKAFSGLNVGIKGFNIYYIFNHRKFSYPAAFSQSTCQKKSCGSPLAGIGYTKHDLSLNYEQLQQTVDTYLPNLGRSLDSGLMFNRVRYTDLSFSGGYAYNWVFAPHWLFAASASMAIAYNYSVGDVKRERFAFRDFTFRDVGLDGVGRFGIVWNNTKYYAGMSAIIHSYNYSKPQFSTNNVFGNLNFYAGFNFGKR